VWLGFDDPKTLGHGETGGQNAAPIFRDVLEAALRGSPPVPFRAPPGVALVRTQVEGGAILEAFRPGTEDAAQAPREPLGSAQLGTERALPGLY
jgi:penicillin-binding protein 1A